MHTKDSKDTPSPKEGKTRRIVSSNTINGLLGSLATHHSQGIETRSPKQMS